MKFGWTICICIVLLVVGVIGQFELDPREPFGSDDFALASIAERGDTEKEEDYFPDLEGCELTDLDLFEEDGVYSREFKECIEIDMSMNRFGFSTCGEVMSFLTESPSFLPHTPLDAASVADLFRLIVALSDEYFPLSGMVKKLSFIKKDSVFFVSGDVDLALAYFAKKCRLDFLPERGVVSFSIRYSIENDVLSAHYNEVLLRLDGCDVPESVFSLFFGYAEERGEVKALFADAVGNVIENACFSR